MFNTKLFGAHLARLRKSADMTQIELADELNLTRQSISKYETGDSFPDISILIRISEIFGTTLDELINYGNPTFGEINILKNVIDSDDQVQINIDDIVNISPYLKPSVLGKFTKRLSDVGINFSHIATLVQFLNDKDILHLIDSAEYDILNNELLEKIIPFLDTTSKEAILKRIIEGESDWHILEPILPYFQDLTRQLEAAVVDGALPKDVLTMINEHHLKKLTGG